MDLSEAHNDVHQKVLSLAAEYIEGRDLDALDRTEGYRWLWRLMKIGMDLGIEYLNPADPCFSRFLSPTRKFGIDNPDTTYLRATITGDRYYRLTGTRGSVHYLGVIVYAGNFGTGRVVASLNDENIEFGPNGEIDLVFGPEPREDGQWVKTDHDVNSLVIREYHLDRDNEIPATLKIEALDGPEVGEPHQDYEVTFGFVVAGMFLEAVVKATDRFIEFVKRAPNVLQPTDPRLADSIMGTPDNRYLSGWFELEPGEALVIEGQPPEARYWNLHLCDRWMASLDDHRSRAHCLNSRQIQLEADGSFRLAIANEDPGLANWLDPGGRSHGWMVFRWLLADETPTVTTRVVSVEELRSGAVVHA